ncbi:putative 2-dehydropantoate 2-reductase [Paludibacter jiangxiensis]|uniref:2-dehydropantoate 2-reductase n=1 Tax=Paludibacter jiangxiensis TaxID=681398 RepID=A0A170YVP0_9BACT|nr:putative 2-dehydropantoate 2-reductase [Paludibacter jiangxiensis]GAT62109.1 2-dehydropantoate 2-reductase [Paludibacter jiangxiensis]
MSLKYAVIGSGALGGFYGGKLAHSGKDVHFLFHSDYEFVLNNGLKVDSVNGDFHLTGINAYQSTVDMPKADVVLVCLKTTNNHLLKSLLSPILHSGTVIVLIQNGLGVEQDVASVFPQQPIVGGLAFICSNKIGDGHIAHLDYGKLNLGVFQGDIDPVVEQIKNDFTEAGVPAEVASNLMQARWQKLVWNIPYNGMTVVLNTTTDRLMSEASTRQLSYDLMLEVINGARACGVEVKESFADKMMELTDSMTPYAPSMKLDFDFKRPMEIEYIYSRPVKAAMEAGYAMKKVAMLESQLRFIQAGLSEI